MSNAMKLLVAYDGSPCANDALLDLQRAGLPDDVEAVVLSVADLWLLPQGETTTPPHVPPLRPSVAIREAQATAAAMLQTAQTHAEEASSRLKQLFPKWQIRAETAADSPAWATVLKAEEWGADLIVVGSHGYSSLGRWVLGSVSQTVLTHAPCSVRIARSRPTPPERPLRILVGIDGSSESDLAVRTVAQRIWPAGTDIRLMMVLNRSIVETLNHPTPNPKQKPPVPEQEITGAQEFTDARDVEELDGMIGRMLESYAAIVAQNPRRATVSTALMAGDPKRVLIEEAEKWGADVIFIGSRGLSRWERLLLGSVSSAVAARAHCPVEVVRPVRVQKQ